MSYADIKLAFGPGQRGQEGQERSPEGHVSVSGRQLCGPSSQGWAPGVLPLCVCGGVCLFVGRGGGGGRSEETAWLHPGI